MEKPKHYLKCDYCGETSEYIPIIEKPIRFYYLEYAHLMVQTQAMKGNRVDLVCLDCLQHEIDALKECY